MAVPFPEAQLEALIYMVLGSLATLVGVLSWRLKKLRSRIGEETGQHHGYGIDRIGLSRRAEEVLETVLEQPELQSDLPDRLEVSKATVSNAVGELSERGLVKRKKKANTFLVEPNERKLEEIS